MESHTTLGIISVVGRVAIVEQVASSEPAFTHGYHWGKIEQSMTASVTPPELDWVRVRLAQYRNQPPNTQDVTEADLTKLFNFLITSPEASDAPVHWFCFRADPVVREAATFMIRLHAYSSNRVQLWRSRLERCLSTCVDCVAGLQTAKVTSKVTYVS